jgi:ketosteroid isomerase-like protein
MPGATDSAASVAAAHFDAWNSNDIELVSLLLHDDVALMVPWDPRGVSRKRSKARPHVRHACARRGAHRWVDGPDVLAWFELRTETAGPLAIVN